MANNSRASPHVAVFVDTATQWGREILRGVIDYSTAHGRWHLWAMPRSRTDPIRLPRGWHVDGIIARVYSRRALEALQQARVPVVNVSAIEVNGCEFPQVTHDYCADAELAIDYYHSLGLTHIGYVGLPKLSFGRRHLDAVQQAIARRNGACSVFTKSGTSVDRPWKTESIQQLGIWLERLSKPVGILTRSVVEGLEVLEAARQTGLEVPYQVAVLACDDDDLLCRSTRPTLSGIEIAASQVGYTAATMLDRLMAGHAIPTEFIAVKPTKIIRRESTDILAIADPLVAQALRYISERAFEPMVVDDVLDELCISRRSLEVRFRNVLGRTPREEIIRLRILRAQELIRGRKMPLHRIAELCGYTSYHYLARVFKKHTGMTIGQYRDAGPAMERAPQQHRAGQRTKPRGPKGDPAPG